MYGGGLSPLTFEKGYFPFLRYNINTVGAHACLSLPQLGLQRASPCLSSAVMGRPGLGVYEANPVLVSLSQALETLCRESTA